MPLDEEIVRSRANPLFKRLRSLKGRSGEGDLCLLEGPTLLGEALDAGVALVEVAVTPAAEERPAVAKMIQRLRGQAVPVRRLAASLLASLSETQATQGIVALAHPPASDEEALFAGNPLVVVAEGLQDPGNLGGLLRTAEGAGASGAYVAAGSADPFSWKALRGSMGSALRLPLVRGLETEAVLERLESRGVPVFATSAEGETRYDEADLAGPAAVVFGREGSGLSEDLLRRAAGRLRIPLARGVESLNVGVAAGLVLFEAARQRGFPSGDGGG
jgi:TrmH family RNA methyltransferase